MTLTDTTLTLWEVFAIAKSSSGGHDVLPPVASSPTGRRVLSDSVQARFSLIPLTRLNRCILMASRAGRLHTSHQGACTIIWSMHNLTGTSRNAFMTVYMQTSLRLRPSWTRQGLLSSACEVLQATWMRSTARSRTQRCGSPFLIRRDWWSSNHLEWSHPNTPGSTQETPSSRSGVPRRRRTARVSVTPLGMQDSARNGATLGRIRRSSSGSTSEC